MGDFALPHGILLGPEVCFSLCYPEDPEPGILRHGFQEILYTRPVPDQLLFLGMCPQETQRFRTEVSKKQQTILEVLGLCA